MGTVADGDGSSSGRLDVGLMVGDNEPEGLAPVSVGVTGSAVVQAHSKPTMKATCIARRDIGQLVARSVGSQAEIRATI